MPKPKGIKYKHSTETKDKIRLAHLGKKTQFREKIITWNSRENEIRKVGEAFFWKD
jgi:hypothetical protein